mmetsp:Transcript_1013/g.1454  ORF Transcript_1013/g.1454 Transcript_1013/m.1454 type:complete len:247 (+) Transcript_1013:1-741(+)
MHFSLCLQSVQQLQRPPPHRPNPSTTFKQGKKDSERQNNIMNMTKYNTILDLAVIISLVLTIGCLPRGCDAANNSADYNDNEQEQHHHLYDAVTATSSYNNDDSSSSPPEHFQIGSIVELYAESSYFAVPAVIIGYEEEQEDVKSSAQRHILRNSMTNNFITQVESDFIHPYQVYEDETRAWCNVGALRSAHMVPCAIVSHSIDDGGLGITYQVRYLNEREVLVYDDLVYSRVQRKNGRMNGRMVA